MSASDVQESELELRARKGMYPTARIHDDTVPYQRVFPLLEYLELLGVGIRKLLGRSKSHYGPLELKLISRKNYEDIEGAFYENFAQDNIERVVQIFQSAFSSVPLDISNLRSLRTRVPDEGIQYQKVKHLLDFLEPLGISIYGLLGTRITRLESGELKAVSRQRYSNILQAVQECQPAFLPASTGEVDSRKVNGRGSSNKILYQTVKPLLEFLESIGISTDAVGINKSRYESGELTDISKGSYGVIVKAVLFYGRKFSFASSHDVDPNEIMSDSGLPYESVKPLLGYLDLLGLGTKKLLAGSRSRYESGELNLISLERCENIARTVRECQQTFTSPPIIELSRLFFTVYNRDTNEQIAERIIKFYDGLPASMIEEGNPGFPIQGHQQYGILFEALNRMTRSQLEVAKEKLEYKTQDQHYVGKLVYVPGEEMFGIITDINKQDDNGLDKSGRLFRSIKDQGINEGFLWVTFPSQRKPKAFYFGTVNNSV